MVFCLKECRNKITRCANNTLDDIFFLIHYIFFFKQENLFMYLIDWLDDWSTLIYFSWQHLFSYITFTKCSLLGQSDLDMFREDAKMLFLFALDCFFHVGGKIQPWRHPLACLLHHRNIFILHPHLTGVRPCLLLFIDLDHNRHGGSEY